MNEVPEPPFKPGDTAYLGFTGVIDSQTVTRIAAAFNQAVNLGVSDIYFCFSSMGGYIGDGVALYNHLRGLPINLTAHNTGSLSSVAVNVFVAAETRLCSAHSMFMMHPTTQPLPEGTSLERLNSALDSALADEKRLDDILSNRTMLTAEELRPRRFRDIHITPQEAVKFGIAHRIVEFSLPEGKKIFQI